MGTIGTRSRLQQLQGMLHSHEAAIAPYNFQGFEHPQPNGLTGNGNP